MTAKARACLYGIGSVATLWLLALVSAVAFAQEPPARQWNLETAATLLDYVEQIGAHGLDPADYAPEALERAILSDDPQMLERQATATFGLVARDLATGRVRPERRGRYFIASDKLDPARVALLIDRSLAVGSVAGQLDALAPQDAQYKALREALASTTPRGGARRNKLRANLERWRWLPRTLGARHLMVNIPEYSVTLFENGDVSAVHRVIVGKRQTPTPRFSTDVTGVIFNPTWTVPQSIIAESVGSLVRNRPELARARGYVWSVDRGGRLRVTQMPGANNALGRVKLDMPNPLSVYLHDTPSKELFEREERTFSHGCIRTDRPLDLAVTLLANPTYDRQAADAIVAGGKVTRVPLGAPVPIYVVYMTAAAGPDGRVRYFDDPYKLDAAVLAELDRKR